MTNNPDSAHIAVIGLACRFPGAQSPEEFWENLVRGVDAITRFPRRLTGANGSGREYVPAGGFLKDPEWFDAEYFGYSPREARIIDPQQRVFLECAMEALESAGCDPDRHLGTIGVYAGGTDTEYATILRSRRAMLPSVTNWEIRVATGADFLGTRVAYKLGLRGPAVTVRAACATSLVAVHVAVQALLAGDCDLALAGGASVHVPAVPSDYTEGGIISPDGTCRTFDVAAQGIVGGDGVGLVVLKRLPEALAGGDPIHAIIRGSAVNNDGADRVGYTAPGVEGQAAVIRAAQLVAGVDPRTITYVEAHGTATPIGDPIEVAALTRAFRTGTVDIRPGSCAIGSVKTNIGHTDAAAGVAGLIKTVMALERGIIPPSLHFTTPNPQIDFAASPFRVVTSPSEWRPEGVPRRAGVSSFGMGGTNAHVVLEEPQEPRTSSHRPRQLLVLSARTRTALDAATARLAAHLRAHPELPLGDVAWTLQIGRRQHPHRRYALVDGLDNAVRVLTGHDPGQLVTCGGPARSRIVTFMFPGTSAASLDAAEPEFRRTVEECRDAVGLLPEDLVVFAREYALARMWAKWGVRPDAVLGVGVGALVAATVARVLPVREAARLVVERSAGGRFTELVGGAAQITTVYVDDLSGADSALSAFLSDPGQVLLEVGTGRTLTSLVCGHAACTDEHVVIPSLADEPPSMLSAAGRLWLAGIPISWEGMHDGERPAKVPLPTYPFERRRHLVEPEYAPVASVQTGITEEGIPLADVRQVVTGLFGEMLGLDLGDLDLDESFFDLGGDSLVATQFLVRLRKIYSVELTLRSMFEAPTATAFAALVEERVGSGHGAQD